MPNWSPTKFHSRSGRYYRYQESDVTVRILDAHHWEALEPNHTEPHNHYFKVNGRWYLYAETPNQYLFEQPAASSVTLVEPSEHLDNLLNELKQAESFHQASASSRVAEMPKRAYRGVIY